MGRRELPYFHLNYLEFNSFFPLRSKILIGLDPLPEEKGANKKKDFKVTRIRWEGGDSVIDR